MKISRYIPKLAYDNVRKKKSRTLLSFISVMLSSCIIFVSLTLFFTVLSLSKTLSNETSGTWHYAFETEAFNIEDPFRYQASYFTEPNDQKLAYFHLEEGVTFFELQEGSLPQSKNEVIADIADYQIGEQIGTYEIVGLYQPSFEGEAPILSIDESLKQSSCHYFMCDARIQDTNSIDDVALIANVTVSSIIQNQDRITNDIIANYLQDTTTILIMFIVIIIIAILMCLVSIYNVLIVNDEDRRKEIGLLKSIGITIKELKTMLFIEFSIIGIIGGIVGIIIGVGVCSAVLYTVLEGFKVGFNLSFILNPVIILISLISSCALMTGSGFILYRHYFKSNPVSDLKGEPVQYDAPYDSTRFSNHSATWQMFVIYNERIKKQTRNLRRSFFFVMLVVTIFCGIWISNLLYQQNYNHIRADEGIDQAQLILGDRTVYEDFDKAVYALMDQEDTKLESAIVERSILGYTMHMPQDSFSEAYLSHENHRSNYYTSEDVKWNHQNHFGLVLDDVQLKELEKYIVYGSLDDLDENSVVLICNEKGYFTSPESMRNFDQTYQVRLEGMNHGINTPIQFYDVDVIVDLPFEDIELQYSSVNNYLFSLGFTTESFKTLNGGGLSLGYTSKLRLENNANHTNLHHALLGLLNDMDLNADLKLTDYVQVREDGSFAVFIIEVLLYPLFMMLVLVGCININNVLKGNIHIKRTDFATLKSVGMTDYQLRTIMIYEYAENFINAGGITFLLSFPVYFLENFFDIASTFKIGDSFAGMYVMSFAIICPVIVVCLASLSFKHIKNITALDGMKDIT